MDSSSQDRQLPASERKLKKARDDGQVARSRDLGHLAVLGGGGVAIVVLGPWLGGLLYQGFVKQLSFKATQVFDPNWMQLQLSNYVLTGMVVVLAVALLTQLASVAGALATGGWVWSFKPLMPDVSRLNPLKGITQLLAPRKLMDVVKMVLLTSVLTLIAYQFLSSHLLSMAGLVMQPSVMALHTLLGWLTQGLGYTLLALLLVTLIDVPLQIFLHKSDMKMTRQEVKDEHKDSEGNPQLKGRLRQRQREMAQGRSISAVPKADFVVMNPTHFAVAIRYDEATMAAPVVVSMGADLLAMKIRDVARSHEVPVIESPMLARALYANSDIGQDIPAALYSAVAQVLAYVYRLKAALRGEAPMPEQLEPPLVPPELDPYGPHTEAQA